MKHEPENLTEMVDDKFVDHLNLEDHVQFVIRCHLHLENKLNEFIEFYFPNPKAFESDNMTFLHKIRLANAVYFVSNDEIGPLMYLNKMRNRIAHDLDYMISYQVAQEFIATLKGRAREIFDIDKTKHGSENNSHEMVRVVIVILRAILNNRLARARQEHLEIEGMYRELLKKPEDWKASWPLVSFGTDPKDQTGEA